MRILLRNTTISRPLSWRTQILRHGLVVTRRRIIVIRDRLVAWAQLRRVERIDLVGWHSRWQRRSICLLLRGLRL